jgi:hypothetical protein
VVNKADDCVSRAVAGEKKIKLEEEAVQKFWLLTLPGNQVRKLATLDYFEEEEEE